MVSVSFGDLTSKAAAVGSGSKPREVGTTGGREDCLRTGDVGAEEDVAGSAMGPGEGGSREGEEEESCPREVEDCSLSLRLSRLFWPFESPVLSEDEVDTL